MMSAQGCPLQWDIRQLGMTTIMDITDTMVILTIMIGHGTGGLGSIVEEVRSGAREQVEL